MNYEDYTNGQLATYGNNTPKIQYIMKNITRKIIQRHNKLKNIDCVKLNMGKGIKKQLNSM